MTKKEFEKICTGIAADREEIIRHNPIGTAEEILLWMLMNCLVSFLSLEEIETPCFNGTPDAEAYKKAINHILKGRRETDFGLDEYLDLLIENAE